TNARGGRAIGRDPDDRRPARALRLHQGQSQVVRSQELGHPPRRQAHSRPGTARADDAEDGRRRGRELADGVQEEVGAAFPGGPSMKAIRIHEYGGPEVLRREEVPDPQPGPGQVLVKVEAAGINFIEVYRRKGLYPVKLPAILGTEGAGTIAAVGSGVAGLFP